METLQDWLPKLTSVMTESRVLGAVIILVVALIAAKVVDVFIDRVVLAFAARSKFHLDDTIIRLFHKPVWSSVILMGALSAVRWVSPRPPFDFLLVAVLKTFLLIVWSLALNALFRKIAEDLIGAWRLAGRQGVEVIRLGGNMAGILVLAGAAFLFLSFWDINITPLLASAGIVGIAIALAARETLSNFFGGVSVFLDHPFRTGDFIILDSGERGEVVDIGMRSTRILTRDDVQISIPNSIMANTKVINESAPEPRFRVRIKLGVSYGTDVDKLEDLLIELARAGIAIPFPQRDVHIRT